MTWAKNVLEPCSYAKFPNDITFKKTWKLVTIIEHRRGGQLAHSCRPPSLGSVSPTAEGSVTCSNRNWFMAVGPVWLVWPEVGKLCVRPGLHPAAVHHHGAITVRWASGSTLLALRTVVTAHCSSGDRETRGQSQPHLRIQIAQYFSTQLSVCSSLQEMTHKPQGDELWKLHL